MTKRPSLAAIAAPAKVPVPAPAPEAAEPTRPRKGEAGYQAPIRARTKAVMGYFDVAVSRQLRQMALDQDTTIQGLLEEALDDLFLKHGRDQIATAGRPKR